MPEFEEAFGALYLKAYQVAYRILGHRQGAEDVALEALARTYVHWSRAAAHPEGWVARVSANLAISALRRRRPLPAVAAMVSEADAATDRLELQAALRSLSRRQREVVVLRYLADQAEADVAAVLGCSVGTVKQHAARGLAKLRLRLDS